MAVPFANSIDLLKNQILNAVFQNLATAPTSPKEGQFYYNTTDKKMYYYNGTTWLDSTYLLPVASATVLGGIKVGTGLSITTDGVLSATGTDTEIVDNLTSTKTNAALSANQGKVLKGLIDTLQTAINGLGTAASKNTGTASGNIPVLDANGKLNTSVLPALAITEVNTVASQSAMTSLAAQQGDVAIRTDVNKTFILSKEPASTAANWIELQFPVSVTSVNGKTGIITLTGADINATVEGTAKTINAWLESLYNSIESEKDRIDAIENNYMRVYKTMATWSKAPTSYDVTHNLNSEIVSVSLYNNGTQIYAEVSIKDANTVTLKFGELGNITSLTIIVMAAKTNII